MDQSKAISIFNFGDQIVRFFQEDGEIWFVVTDACKALGIANVGNVTSRLDQDGIRQADIIDSLGRKQNTTIGNEPNFWRLVFRSDKPEAKEFQDRVYREVLPSIRKYGCYPPPAEDVTSVSIYDRHLLDIEIRLARLEARLPSPKGGYELLEDAIMKTLIRVGPLTPAKIRSSYLKKYSREEIFDALVALVSREALDQFATSHAPAKFEVKKGYQY